ncbi:hypothetical protein SUGI_0319390, partial [Cryptomeria japonica]
AAVEHLEITMTCVASRVSLLLKTMEAGFGFSLSKCFKTVKVGSFLPDFSTWRHLVMHTLFTWNNAGIL